MSTSTYLINVLSRCDANRIGGGGGGGENCQEADQCFGIRGEAQDGSELGQRGTSGRGS